MVEGLDILQLEYSEISLLPQGVKTSVELLKPQDVVSHRVFERGVFPDDVARVGVEGRSASGPGTPTSPAAYWEVILFLLKHL